MVFIHSQKNLQDSKLFIVSLLFVAGVNTIMSENGLWNVSLTLLHYLWTDKYFMGCLMSGLAYHCILVRILSMFCSHRHTASRTFDLWTLFTYNIVKFGIVPVFAIALSHWHLLFWFVKVLDCQILEFRKHLQNIRKPKIFSLILPNLTYSGDTWEIMPICENNGSLW